MIYWPAKAPGEEEDFLFDFTDSLEDGETILTRVVSVSDATKVSDAIVDVDTKTAAGVLVWLSGGTFGTNATVACTVTTNGGRTYSATAVLLIGEEPISLAQAKDYLRIFHDDEDTKIPGMITRARQWVEDHTGLALVQRQFVERHLPQYGAIRLYKQPLVSVDSIDYVDADGVTGTYEPLFWAGTSTIFPVAGGTWPTLGLNEQFAVTYTAGLAPDETDDRLLGAMYALIEGEYSDGFAYPERATDAAERCCGQLRMPVL